MVEVPLQSRFKYQLSNKSGLVNAGNTPQASGNSDSGEQESSIVDSNGMVLTNIQVHLIFWGSAWSGNGSPSAQDITNAVTKILSGPYMTGLSQYRNIGYGTLHGTTIVTSSNPPNPFSADDIAHFILNLIGTKQVPKPGDVKQIWYCVILPPQVNFNNQNVNGEHSFILNASYDFPLDLEINMVHYGWVMNDGTLDSVTVIFSHELVESCTNPEGSGFQITPIDPNSWHEIGDMCEGITGVVNGVSVQGYWSGSDGTCIIPSLQVSSEAVLRSINKNI